MTTALAIQILAVFVVFGVVAHAHRQQPQQQQQQLQQRNVTSTADEYIIQNRRQYAAVIADYDRDIAAYNLIFEQRLAIIDIQKNLLIEKLAETNARINPLELLNDQNKLCVRTNRNIIPNTESVSTAIARCISTAKSYNYIIHSVTGTRTSLQNYYNNNLNTLLNDCTVKHFNVTSNYTLCVTQAIGTANAYTANNKKTFEEQLQQAHCNADIRIKQALNCSFNTTYHTISSIGNALGLIERCTAESTQCQSCLTDNARGYCANVIDVSFRPLDFRNTSIVNPFFGLDRNTPCVLFNFNKPLYHTTPAAA